jgi:hypothetical protein
MAGENFLIYLVLSTNINGNYSIRYNVTASRVIYEWQQASERQPSGGGGIS